MLYAGYTLGNDQLRGIRYLLCKSLTDLRIRSRIHRTGTVVQNQYLRLLEQCPCNTEPLFLPAGYIRTTLFYVCVIAIRHLLDKFIRTGQPAYPLAFLLVGISISPAQILKNRT